MAIPVRIWLSLLCLLTAAATVRGADDRVQLVVDSRSGTLEVRGLTAAELEQITRRAQSDGWNSILALYVGRADAAATPILGKHQVRGDVLRFQPRFPLQGGLSYSAIFHGAATIRKVFKLPAPELPEPARVTHIYPSSAALPENQLKFYLHFSAPMSQGRSYQHIHLLRADGSEVELPFLELGEELWSQEGTRLTLLLDPGRIKQGLKPREEEGPALEAGKHYALVIDQEWLDASGQPLQASFRKEFRVIEPDTVQPDPARWQIVPPVLGTRGSLTVVFDEPLEHALLERLLKVRKADGELIEGKIQVDQQETRWRFTPEMSWSAEAYELVVETILEDLAGNSIGRPFEVDVVRPIEQRITTETVAIPFHVR